MSKPTVPHIYLLEWRKHFDLTQEELGERMGKTRGQISELETGVRQWDFAIAGQAARALGVDPWTMLLGLPEEELELANALAGIPADRKGHALEVLKTFAKSKR